MADITVKDINVQAVETPTYLWGVNALGRVCKVVPWSYPVTSVIGLTGAITQGDLRTALGLGNAAYLNTGTAAGTVAVGNHTHTPASLGAEPAISSGTTAQYWRGDKAWATLDKAAVGLNNVDNTSDADKPISSATSSALSGKEPTIAAGTAGQYWRGDKTWATFPSIQTPVQYNEEGVQVAPAGNTTIVNFTGAGVDTTFVGNTLTVNIPNSGGGGWTAVDASSTVKGILKLTNDLGGTADLPVVAKINGVAISGTCASGSVITGDSASTASWKTLASAGIAPTASPSFTGNVSLTSSGARILGDFSNATVANRVAFQSNVTNGATVIPVVPNGTATVAGAVFYNSTDSANAQFLSMNAGSGTAAFSSSYAGAPGSALPMVWNMAGVERMRLLPTGEVGIGTAPTAGHGTLQVPDINGGATSGFKNKIINGCMRISKKGSGAAALGWNYFGADGIGTYIGGWSAVTGTINTESSATDAKTSSGADHFVNLSSATGSSGYIAFVARIEAADSLELKDKPITVSARIINWSKQVDSCSIKIYKANAFNNFTTTTLLFISSEQGPISVNTIKDISFTTSIAAADLVNGIQIEVLNAYTSAVSASMHLFITDLQCRQSSKVEPFELRPIAIEEQLRQRYYRKQAVWIGTSTARTCFPINMVKTPTLSGGGTGFTSTGTDKDTFVAYQTTAALQTITLDAEL